jgi:hypothetical protein
MAFRHLSERDGTAVVLTGDTHAGADMHRVEAAQNAANNNRSPRSEARCFDQPSRSRCLFCGQGTVTAKLSSIGTILVIWT